MNLKTFTGGIAAALIALSASSASAVTFDFSALVTGLGEGSWSSRGSSGSVAGGSFNGATDTYTVGGIGVVATGAYTGGGTSNGVDAYLDANPGVGVCHNFSGTQCDPGSDDNVTADETLTLTFTTAVSIVDSIFRSAGHPLLTSGSILINGVANSFTTGGKLANAVTGTNTVWTFDYVDTEFYLDTAEVAPIPIPPALLLFGTALGGMGLLARRRKKAA